MDLALNTLQRLICYKTQTTNYSFFLFLLFFPNISQQKFIMNNPQGFIYHKTATKQPSFFVFKSLPLLFYPFSSFFFSKIFHKYFFFSLFPFLKKNLIFLPFVLFLTFFFSLILSRSLFSFSTFPQFSISPIFATIFIPLFNSIVRYLIFNL